MDNEELKYGAVLFTEGEYRGKLGYYDDDENDLEAIVYLGQPFQSNYVVVPFSHIRNVTSLEHEKFKKENPEFSEMLGIE